MLLRSQLIFLNFAWHSLGLMLLPFILTGELLWGEVAWTLEEPILARLGICPIQELGTDPRAALPWAVDPITTPKIKLLLKWQSHCEAWNASQCSFVWSFGDVWERVNCHMINAKFCAPLLMRRIGVKKGCLPSLGITSQGLKPTVSVEITLKSVSY